MTPPLVSLAAAVGAAVALLGPMPAGAFTLEIDGASGVVVEPWESSDITFDVNYADCLAQGVAEADLDAVVDRALAMWNSVSTASLNARRGPRVTKTVADLRAQSAGSKPLIACDANLSAHLGKPGDPPVQTSQTPAVTQILKIDPRSQRLSVVGVYINAEPGSVSSVKQVIHTAGSLEVVLAHELGHALGLGHSPDVNALMYYSDIVRAMPTLGRDDMAGITYLYPRHEIGDSGLFGCGSLDRREQPPAGGGTPRDACLELAVLALACWLSAMAAKPRQASHASAPAGALLSSPCWPHINAS